MIVYKILNDINDKVYIGITSKTLEERFNWHLRDCRRGVPKKLYNAIREIGEENFRIELLEICNTDTIREKEEFYIEKYNAYDKGYNASQKSGGVRSHTTETKLKMSLIATGRKASPETKLKQSTKQKEIWAQATDEKRQYYAELASKRNTGRVRTKEQREHHSKMVTGKRHSAETIGKMKESRKGKILSLITDPVKCPHCETQGKSNAMYRWHFDRCKDKK